MFGFEKPLVAIDGFIVKILIFTLKSFVGFEPPFVHFLIEGSKKEVLQNGGVIDGITVFTGRK